MKTLNIDISNSDIGSYVLDATPSNVQFVFSGLPDAWSGAIIYASFIQDAKNILVEAIDNSVAVPVEILADSTDFYVGINAVEYGTGKLVGYSMPVLVTIKVPESKGTDVQKLIQLILKIGGIEDRLSDVAKSGDYNDLLNKPVIDTIMNAESSNAVSNGTITKFIDDTVAKFTNGDITVDKASRDELGNYFQTTYATKEELSNQGIQLIELDPNGSWSLPERQELSNISTPGIYKLYFSSAYKGTGWLIVCDHDDSPTNITQTLIDTNATIYVRRRGYEYGDDVNAWSEWIEYVTKDVSDNTYLSKTDASTSYSTKEELERLKYYGDKDIIPSDESYFTVNSTGETITGLTDTGKTQTELVIPYKINGKEITTLYSGVGDGILQSILNGSTTITKITIPKSVTSIGEAAFLGCSSLTSINIPSSVATIGTYVFNSCSSLTSVNIPNSVTSIGKGTFTGCTSLTSVNIPDGVTSIGDYAFQACTSLTSINIPDSVASIGDYAFRGCNSLTSINIPNSVTIIGNSAFDGCTNLTIYCEQGSYAETYANTNNIPVKYTDIDSSKYITKDTVESTYATKEEVGNISTALDNIIAIQNNLLGVSK